MTDFQMTAAFILLCVATARLTRLIVWDVYPPVARLRAAWDGRTEGSDWNVLLHCGYCFGFWAAVATCAWTVLDYWPDHALEPAWWITMGLLAVSYIAAGIMAYDGDD